MYTLCYIKCIIEDTQNTHIYTQKKNIWNVLTQRVVVENTIPADEYWFQLTMKGRGSRNENILLKKSTKLQNCSVNPLWYQIGKN